MPLKPATENKGPGSVKPSHAMNAPNQPALKKPIENPTWLYVGPGSIWHKLNQDKYSS